MPIDYSRLRGLTAREMVSALVKDGFRFRPGSSGGHRQFKHPDGRRVTVSYHTSGDTFHPKILKSMIEAQARWTETDLRRLGLIS